MKCLGKRKWMKNNKGKRWACERHQSLAVYDTNALEAESRHRVDMSQSVWWTNEKKRKRLFLLVQMCLLCTHSQTHAVDLVWKSLIKTLTIKIIDPDSSWPSLWFWEKRRRKKERKQTSKTRSSHQTAAAAALITKGILYCCCLFYIVEK